MVLLAVEPVNRSVDNPIREPKRLVIEHTDGPLKGLFRIVGLTPEPPPSGIHGPLSIGGEEHIIEFASLIKVHPRWCHYRELFKPSLERFNEPLKDFHPDQI